METLTRTLLIWNCTACVNHIKFGDDPQDPNHPMELIGETE